MYMRCIFPAFIHRHASTNFNVRESPQGESLACIRECELGSDVPGYRSDGDDLGMTLSRQALQPQQGENVVATRICVKENLPRLISILCGVNHICYPKLASHDDARDQQ
jgi:hypothetical protein